MDITITLSVEDTCKLMRLVNQASLVSSNAAAVALPDVAKYDEHMKEYNDTQRILDLITDQANAAC